MNGKIHFGWRVQGVPVDGQGVVGELLYVAHQPQAVLGVHVDDALLDLKHERCHQLGDFNGEKSNSNNTT